MKKILLVISRGEGSLTKQLLLEWGFSVDIYKQDLDFSKSSLDKFQSFVVNHDIDLVIPLGEDASVFCDGFKKLYRWPFVVSSISEILNKIINE